MGIVLMDSIVFVLEVLGLFGFLYSGELISVRMYLIKCLLIPTGINVGAILITWKAVKRKGATEKQKNQIVCYLLVLSCIVIECTHSIFPIAMCLPCIAIFLTVLFLDVKINRIFFVGAVIGILISVWTNYLAGHLDLFYSLLNMILALIITSVSFYEANLLSEQERQQMEDVIESYRRQLQLLSELQIEPETGVYNQGAFWESLEAKYAQVRRKEKGMHLVILASATVEEIEQREGLRNEIGSILKETLNKEGSAYQFEEGQFACLFDKQSLKEVYDLTLKIQKAVKEKYGILLYAGIARLEEDWGTKEWLDKAQKALYQAIGLRKDRPEIYEEITIEE